MDNRLFEDDPEPTSEPRPGFQWARNEFGWCQERIPTKRSTPEGRLKKACREALSNWKHRTGIYAKLVSYSVGHFKTRDGSRSYKIGTDGTGDMLIGTCGTTLMVETKIPGRKQSESQREMERDWRRTGQPYVVAYKPSDLIDALDQIAAQRGKLF